MKKLKIDIFMRQSYPLKLINNMSEFYIIIFKELSSCRNIIKKIFHRKVRTFHGLNRFLKLESAAFNINIGSRFRIFGLRFQFYLRHCCDGRQSFATKTFGCNFENIFGCTDFRSCVTLESQSRIGIAHSATVVNDLN